MFGRCAALLVLLGCDGSEAPPAGTRDAGARDAATRHDASGLDAGRDAGSGDAERPAPGYRPFALADCNDGTPGEDAVGPDALAETIGAPTTYSDEQAVDGSGLSCRSTGEADQNFFGGRYRTDGADVGSGDDLWMRHALYFPDGFCFGYGTREGDGWGATKWMRIEFDNGDPVTGGPGDRLTLQLGNMARQGCNDSGTLWGATREYAGATNAEVEGDNTIETGRWQMIQWHVHFAPDETGFIRFWIDDRFLGEWRGQTIGDDDPRVDMIVYGDYWNGSPYQDVAWYLDEVIMTSEAPDTLDAEGHPYISPSARADDWD
jgi:hypothetical protein